MNQDLSHLSLEELHALAARAQKALEDKRRESRRAVIAQIKELADSIGVMVTITTDGQKPGGSAAIYGLWAVDDPGLTMWSYRGFC